jgi:NADP-dependent 3-hydroxy acid dehydrogenase YdfG
MQLPDINKVFDISGKVALITGATGGFGAIACKTMVAAGAKVMVTGRSEDTLKSLTQGIKGCRGRSRILGRLAR